MLLGLLSSSGDGIVFDCPDQYSDYLFHLANKILVEIHGNQIISQHQEFPITPCGHRAQNVVHRWELRSLICLFPARLCKQIKFK